MKFGKNKEEYKLIIDNQALLQILNKYQDVRVHNNAIALDYESIQLYFALEALKLYMEEQLLEPNYRIDLDE